MTRGAARRLPVVQDEAAQPQEMRRSRRRLPMVTDDTGLELIPDLPANDETGLELIEDEPDLNSYDYFVVAFSGGKDSLWCLLHLLFEQHVPREKVELWHHEIDGREGSRLMDWPVTRAYCQAVADAFGLPIYYSWREGGFEREMLKDNTPSAPIIFEHPHGVSTAGGTGKPGTRLLFPQTAADLNVRWCSSYLKIDVGSAAIRNQERFVGRRTLFITGERAEESPARGRYKRFEPHRADLRNGRHPRHVDWWRPAHDKTLREVWELIAKHRITPHPAYRLGWGRLSCAGCIFGNPAQWASLRVVNPQQFDRIAAYEERFGKTINRKYSVTQLADRGRPYAGMRACDMRAALSDSFDEPVILDEWRAPAGRFGDTNGPT